MKRIFSFTIIFLLFFVTLSWSATIMLGWDPNTETDLAGYRLYWSEVPNGQVAGTSSPNYIDAIAAGMETFSQLDVPPGTYYYKLTAFDLAGNESGFSNEVEAIVPIDAPDGFIVNVAWNEHSQKNYIAGFKLYHGDTPREVSVANPSQGHPYSEVDVVDGGTAVSYVVNLPTGRHYLTLTAFQDTNESDFSDEVVIRVPGEAGPIESPIVITF